MASCPRCNEAVDEESTPEHVLLKEQRWHKQCAQSCMQCGLALEGMEVTLPLTGENASMPHHKECALVHCDVCGNQVSTNAAGVQTFYKHPVHNDRSCPEHLHDGTRICIGCRRFEGKHVPSHSELEDGSPLCTQCISTAVLTHADVQPLLSEALRTFDAPESQLGITDASQVPLVLVTATELHSQRGPLHGASTCRGFSEFKTQPRNPSAKPELLQMRLQKGLPRYVFAVDCLPFTIIPCI